MVLASLANFTPVKRWWDHAQASTFSRHNIQATTCKSDPQSYKPRYSVGIVFYPNKKERTIIIRPNRFNTSSQSILEDRIIVVPSRSQDFKTSHVFSIRFMPLTSMVGANVLKPGSITSTMKTQTQVFDPDGDLTFILTHHPNTVIESRDFTPELGLGFDLNLDSKEPDEEHEVRMQVSSKHLTLASPVFKAMLRHSFREGAGLREFGSVEIPLPEDNPDAFSILMNIIHAKNKAVPRHMSLPLLTTIAILVDKYELHESTDLFANTWIDALKTSMPETFCKQLISWICITWVFRRPAEFTWASFVAIKQSTGLGFETVYEDFDTLPIPGEIIEAINMQREQAMEKILECLRIVVHGIQESKSHHCPAHRQECEALLLGTLLRSASKFKLWPIMESPYPGLSFKEVSYGIGALYIKSFCSQERGVYYATADDSHGIKTILKAELKEIEMHLRGLQLKDFINPL